MPSSIKFIRNLYTLHGFDYVGSFHCYTSRLSIYVAVDGHSQREGSTDLVAKFIKYLCTQQAAFQRLEGIESEIRNFIAELLYGFQESVKRELPRSAMSLMIIVASVDYLHVFFLGDCRLGEVEGKTIKWLTRPHSCILQTAPDMSEEELRDSEHNHAVYKQFIAIRRMVPEYLRVNSAEKIYILCTDGFWKLTQEEQAIALDSKPSIYNDDIAYLIFTNDHMLSE